MNPICMITYNNLELTKLAVESALAQDVDGGVWMTIVNNGSTDGTRGWLDEAFGASENVDVIHRQINTPVVQIANDILKELFRDHLYVLGIPNDVILHPSTYREFLKWPRGIVTGSEIRNRLEYETYISNPLPPTHAISENTPMAVMLTRKWAWDALIAKDGYFFDERFTHYASDCDLALRISSCGIRGVQLSAPYFHVGSATHRLPEIHAQSCRVADMDRAKFVEKWGFRVDSLEYGQLPADPNFTGIRSSQ